MATDDFNRTAEDPLSQGGNWSTVGSLGSFETNGTQAHPNAASTDCVMRYSGATFNSNHSSEVTYASIVSVGGQFFGVGTRLTSGGDGYLGQVIAGGADTFRVYRLDSSSFTQIASGSLTSALAQNDVIKLTSNGSTHTLTVNDVLAGTGADPTDSNHTGGEPGLAAFDTNTVGTGTLYDDWEGVDLTTDISLVPPQADLVLSTSTPLAVNTGAYLYTPPQADLTLSTVAPNVDNTEQNKIPATADLVLSTEAPNLGITARTFLDVPAADLFLTGTAPTLEETVASKVPAAADLTLSTTAPSLSLTGERVPAAADLVLSPTAPVLTFADNHFRIPLGGNLLLSTTAPSLGAVVESDDPSYALHIGKSIIAAKGASLQNVHTGYGGILGKR